LRFFAHWGLHVRLNGNGGLPFYSTLLLTAFTQGNFVADFLWEKCTFILKAAVLPLELPQEGLETKPVERPPYPPGRGRGTHVCLGASCYVWEKISGRVQMFDGCCSVRWRLEKRSPENWGWIVVVRGGGAHFGLRRHCLATTYAVPRRLVGKRV